MTLKVRRCRETRMDHPWGLSGPEFLQLYGAALFVLLLLSVAVALLAKSDGRRADLAGGADLGAYELAYLFGGVDRVAETAVAGLVEAGSVRVTRSRELVAAAVVAVEVVAEVVEDELRTANRSAGNRASSSWSRSSRS